MGHIEMVKLKSEYSRGFPKTTLRELIFAVDYFGTAGTKFRGWGLNKDFTGTNFRQRYL